MINQRIPKIQAVLFDYGNVIAIDTDNDILNGIICISEKNREIISSAFKEELNDLFRGTITEETFWTRFSHKICYTGDIQQFYSLFRETSPAYSEIQQLIKCIKEKGTKVGVLSNIIAPFARIRREKGEYAYFDSVTLSCDVGYRKPQKEIYYKALQDLGLDRDAASYVVFVDDKKEYLAVAQEIGMLCVHFNLQESNAPLSDLEKTLRANGVKV